MKHLLITTIAAVLLVGCGESQQSAPPAGAKPVEPVAEVATPEPPTAKAPDISIHEAAETGNIEAVKQHLAAGTDVNAKDKNVSERIGAQNSEFDPVTGEMKKGSDHPGGWTPLVFAAYSGHKEIVELLITAGADVNAKDSEGTTPLGVASSESRTEIAELLIAAGADVNANDSGLTPLYWAASNGNKEIAELLINNGADVNAKLEEGHTPLDWAIEWGETETADFLRKLGGKTSEELEAEGK